MLENDVLVLDMPKGDARSLPTAELRPTNPPIMIPGIHADGSLYPVEKIQAHIDGSHHLAISVFIFAGDELLIQQRAHEKYHCGGLWANTVCTHPHFDEDEMTAARRRLKEELGLQLRDDQILSKRRIVDYSADVGNGLWERERVHMFRLDTTKDAIALDLNPEEVCNTRWITGADLLKDIDQNPNHYTPWFRIYVQTYPDLDF